jgi:hypothetical protein
MKLLATFLALFLLFSQQNKTFAQEVVPSSSPTNESSIPDVSALGVSKFSNPHYALTAAVEVPQPLTLGVEVSWDSLPQLQAFLEGGYFKYSLSSGRDISEFGFMTGVHYHPCHNWFYVGGSIGYRHLGFVADISSLKSDTGQVIASNATLSLNALFLGLFVGGEWAWSERLSFSADLGAQFAMLHGGEINILPSPGSPPYDLSVTYQQTTDRLSGFPLPQIALMRFIYKL